MTSSNHLFPFFWQHGEDHQVLQEYVAKIDQSGMHALCVESRPHPDFVGEQWWSDLQVIIDECKKRQMKVWILDDSHFPTGFANGKIASDFPDLKKQYLSMRRFDIVGPFNGARIDAASLKGRPWETKATEVIDLLGVFLARRSDLDAEGDPIASSSLIDISDQYVDNTITLDIPEGHWSVFVVFSTYEGGEESTNDYLNPLVAEATQVLVDEVYESHYNHFGKEFGTTITAFFSDEPRFGNDKGTQSQIGKSDMVLPWRPGLEELFFFDRKFLPLLWVVDKEEAYREVRYDYMNVVTKEYNKNFVQVLADWCQNHGVEYLGHNIEDNGAHARLGYGAGHFFRGQEAQHYAGIDVIGGQVVPGMPYQHDAYQTGGSDGRFYHYALAKLGSSAAALYPHKKGRVMCEAFGAYGWNEGLKTMKWIADHLMVRGVNTIVPHAFSPKAFPDFDCPPHFYAHGHNPQFRYMPSLTSYLNRMMSLISGGQEVAHVALFYPAEFEWVGQAMSIEVPAKILTQAQIDFSIVCHDLLHNAEVIAGQLQINGRQYANLIIPYAQYIPKDILESFNKLAAKGLTITLLDNWPENQSALIGDYKLVALSDLVNSLSYLREFTLSRTEPDLVYYHYRKDQKDYWLFFNESISKSIDTTVTFKSNQGRGFAYDVYLDCKYAIIENHLHLAPYESLVWVFDQHDTREPLTQPFTYSSCQEVVADWQVSFASALDYPHSQQITEIESLTALSQIEGFDRKVGTAIYETSLQITEPSNIVGLDLGGVYEIAQVWLNDQPLETRIAPPYVFQVSDELCSGKNTLRIEVTNTLGTAFRGGLNQYLLVEPFGLTGPVKWLFK